MRNNLLTPSSSGKAYAGSSFSTSRLKRVRFSWFFLGSACGIALTLSIDAYSRHSPAPEPVQAEAPAAVEPGKEKQSALAPDAPALALPAAMQLRVNKGDTLVAMLTDTGISFEEAHEAVEALRKVYDPRKLDIGAKVAVNLDPRPGDSGAPTLASMTLPVSSTASVELERRPNGEFSAKKVEVPVEKKVVKLGGRITNSFYQAGLRYGIPAETLSELIKVYSYDVDFQRDIKRGHGIEVLMEQMQTKEGVTVKNGNVVFASLDLGSRKLSVYRYTDKAGNADYYNEKGESLRKALLRTPINGARITSGFGMRMHPLLGYSKMHRGVDFGASQGTPIYAAGDGTVAFAGWKGGYGNYVQIKHNGTYATAYGHASRIASGIKSGSRVKQGQIIAYVGSTGQSTGPHLHYEVLKGGDQVNPSGIKFKTGTVLAGAELKKFKAQVSEVQTALNEGKAKTVASR